MITSDLLSILDVSAQLITEKDNYVLYDLIITSAMNITHADAGTLYIYDSKEDVLRFTILRNLTLKTFQGDKGEAIDLPPVPMSLGNVSTCCALLKKVINIKDVYHNEHYDFSGPKAYDKLTGYYTKSMLVLPLVDVQNNVIGVLQLINAKSEDGAKIVPFSKESTNIVMTVATQTTLKLTNVLYLDDIKKLNYSFIKVLSAIESKRVYNKTHTRNIAECAAYFAEYLNTNPEAKYYNGFFDEDATEQLVIAAWMHDIGKILTPDEVLNKGTKLEGSLDELLIKFDIAKTTAKIDMLEGRMDEASYKLYCHDMDSQKTFITEFEKNTHASDEDLKRVHYLKNSKFTNQKGEQETFLNDYEYACLSVKYGTLTNDERLLMNKHVNNTKFILDKVGFTRNLKDVSRIASLHHEYLDGSGYPYGLKGDHIPIESRILTILDIYDALVRPDRPKKVSYSHEDALDILDKMAEKGKLDAKLVKHFKEVIKIKMADDDKKKLENTATRDSILSAEQDGNPPTEDEIIEKFKDFSKTMLGN